LTFILYQLAPKNYLNPNCEISKIIQLIFSYDTTN
jgi:hypothetical protein